MALLTKPTGNSLVAARKPLRPGLVLFLMSLPFVLLILAFNYLPLLGWSIAFVDYQPGMKILDCKFIGLTQFARIFSLGSDFGMVMRNTLVLSFLGIICSPVPIVLALMLAEVKKPAFSRAVQTITSFPYFISWILIFGVVYIVLAQSDSVLNTILFKLHLITRPVNVLANPDIVWPFQTLLTIYKTAGWQAIIYLAAIAGIDPELYDAAEVDGAGRLGKMRYITIPGLMPTYTVLLLLQISNVLSNGFEQYYVFHNALVHDKIAVLDYYLYQTGLGDQQFSYSTAMGIFKTVVSVTLLFSANWISKKVRGESII